MVNLFVTLIHFWWWEFTLMQIQACTFLTYAFVICFAALLLLSRRFARAAASE